MDGLGRGLQSLAWKASPDKTKDVITATNLFDVYNRNHKNILPTPSDGILGAYKSTALNYGRWKRSISNLCAFERK
jgi:Domain of unknown function (DUF6443)